MRRLVSLILVIILLTVCLGCFWGDRGGGEPDRGGYHEHERGGHEGQDRGGHDELERGGNEEHEGLH
jgi:hypothetical protein